MGKFYDDYYQCTECSALMTTHKFTSEKKKKSSISMWCPWCKKKTTFIPYRPKAEK